MLSIYLAFMLLSLTGALSPGPLMTMAISEGARSGRWAGVRLALGHGLIEIPLVFGIAYGLGAWLQHPLWRGLIGLVGAVVLVWMGWGLITGAWQGRLRLSTASAGENPPDAQRGAETGAPGGGLLRFGHIPGGVMLTVTNPYWSFWWATVGAGRITDVTALSFTPLAIGGLALAHWLTDLGWLGGLSFLTASGRGLIGDRVYRGILLVCGAFLVAFGLYLGWTGVTVLM